VRGDLPGDLEPEVRAIEAADDLLRVAEPQHLHDVGAHRGSRGGGQRQHRRVAQELDGLSEPQVVRAEVVAPRRDAVSLVHHEQ
jgi:hypothetical protein